MSAAVLRSSARGSQTTGSVQREREKEREIDRGGTRGERKNKKRNGGGSEASAVLRVWTREKGGEEIEIKQEYASPMNCVLWKHVSCSKTKEGMDAGVNKVANRDQANIVGDPTAAGADLSQGGMENTGQAAEYGGMEQGGEGEGSQGGY
ncbi:uncharacterized protein isoform X2 [Salmo salar]|uniref:Uncharacterized protein isoform X2 n=1 Tax=Salmo salar TaxID=8030 RepID=A0A1S3Q4F2_SALSA|nr:uncharacterized protein LOC106589424 isoform X2 [Salmo salar]|eukprot:XP_014034873.1 PREDICTED: uncharacterized protein LOC106589424 isoform X2 [Salmo salar]